MTWMLTMSFMGVMYCPPHSAQKKATPVMASPRVKLAVVYRRLALAIMFRRCTAHSLDTRRRDAVIAPSR
jgi:hypothetical protein